MDVRLTDAVGGSQIHLLVCHSPKTLSRLQGIDDQTSEFKTLLIGFVLPKWLTTINACLFLHYNQVPQVLITFQRGSLNMVRYPNSNCPVSEPTDEVNRWRSPFERLECCVLNTLR
jgi:hypothetical protein